MEELYRKQKNGKYKLAGYSGVPDLSDGIWMVQSKEACKTTSNLLLRISDLKRPVDVTTQAAMFSIGDELSAYLLALNDQNTEEWKHAKEFLAGWLSGEVNITNISMYDLSSLILKFIANKIEKEIVK